jgi:hypothetical protein
LNPHDQRFDTANHQEHDPVNDVEDAQLLVVHGDNPVVQPFADWPGVAANCAERDSF